ncbi:MAG: hypothetical protein NT129_05065 [Candidatus Aenigmarchaeota archaeon]|nr:hypothetical protein [Candidatus Aenigmarchaeota archaeon]
MEEDIPVISRRMGAYFVSVDDREPDKEIDKVIDYITGAGIRKVRYGYDLGPVAVGKLAKAGIKIFPPEYKV